MCLLVKTGKENMLFDSSLGTSDLRGKYACQATSWNAEPLMVLVQVLLVLIALVLMLLVTTVLVLLVFMFFLYK